jgi:alpha-glucosidase
MIAKTLYILAFVFSPFLGVCNPLELFSPDGRLCFKIGTNDNKAINSIEYDIFYDSIVVIERSSLGIAPNVNHYSAASDWRQQLYITDSIRSSYNSTWVPVSGEYVQIVDHYNELTISLKSVDASRKGVMQIVARAYNSGIAFRYVFPENINTQILDIGNENTTFNLPTGVLGYYTERAQGSYELKPVIDWKLGAELPLTLKYKNGMWVCLTQAAQIDYARMRLVTSSDNKLRAQLHSAVVASSPFESPWRVILVASNPLLLAQANTIIPSLNKPSVINDVKWIRSGKVLREVTLSTNGAIKAIDFAVKQNIDFIEFDAGWYGHEYSMQANASMVNVDPLRNKVNDLQLDSIVRYAKSKGKGVILYVNRRALETQMDTIFPLYKKWGIAGVKFGFVQTGSQYWSHWLYNAIKKAADNQLMVDVHDEYMPSGLNRTLPNLMTQEGVRGNEEFPDATHNTVLPFTRMIAGPADYTFCFLNTKLKTTKCHQLALPIIYFSPWQFLHWYDKPGDYKDFKEVEFWKDMPTTWDDTKYLDGTPGEFVAIARRTGNTWFYGVITNNLSRKVRLNLSFLTDGEKYRADIYEDKESSVVKQTAIVNSEKIMTLSLNQNGGAAVVFTQL